jgi:hypothetical protein
MGMITDDWKEMVTIHILRYHPSILVGSVRVTNKKKKKGRKRNLSPDKI